MDQKVMVPYRVYKSDALRTISRELLSRSGGPLEDNPTSEQAKEMFLLYVSLDTESFLARFQEQHGERFLQDLPDLWPLYVTDPLSGWV